MIILLAGCQTPQNMAVTVQTTCQGSVSQTVIGFARGSEGKGK